MNKYLSETSNSDFFGITLSAAVAAMEGCPWIEKGRVLQIAEGIAEVVTDRLAQVDSVYLPSGQAYSSQQRNLTLNGDSRMEHNEDNLTDVEWWANKIAEERPHIESDACRCGPAVVYVPPADTPDVGEVLDLVGMDVWEIRRIVEAHEVVRKYDLSYEDAKRAYEDAYSLQRWLTAEREHEFKVARWLEAERRWHLMQHVLANDPTYQAAETGWLKMKEMSPNLDGVNEFSQLSASLQSRYAIFADAVLSSQGHTILRGVSAADLVEASEGLDYLANAATNHDYVDETEVNNAADAVALVLDAHAVATGPVSSPVTP